MHASRFSHPLSRRRRVIATVLCTVVGTMGLGGFVETRASTVTCDATWNGSVSYDPQNADNWTPAAVPTAEQHACVPAGKFLYGLTVGSIDIGAGSIIAGSITLEGTQPSVNDGTIDLGRAGQILIGSGGLTNSGVIRNDGYWGGTDYPLISGNLVNSASGTITIPRSVSYTGGTLTNHGTLSISRVNAATTVLSVDASGGGITNDGTISFGPASTIDVSAGTLTLGGTARVDITPNPAIGTSLAVITHASPRVGNFATVVEPWIADNRSASQVSLVLQPVVDIVDQVLPTGTDGDPYGPIQFEATGGTGPYSWSAELRSAYTLYGYPSVGGLTMSTSGVLSGTPTLNPLADNSVVRVTATDSDGHAWTEEIRDRYPSEMNKTEVLPAVTPGGQTGTSRNTSLCVSHVT